MKKYVKPELFYEHFELSQHIADCGWEMKNGGVQTFDKASSCVAYADPNYWGEGYTETLFTTANGCSIDSSVYQEYCYEAGSGGIKVAVS